MENRIEFHQVVNSSCSDHPHDETLERFLLGHCGGDEIEEIETHAMACESCVERLESLEQFIQAAKLALHAFQLDEKAKAANPVINRVNWFTWLTFPRLSFAGAALATLTVAVFFVCSPREIDLVANRGDATVVAPQWRPLHLRLDAKDLAAGNAVVDIVDEQGRGVWKGNATVQNEAVDMNIGPLTVSGEYLVRISDSFDHELLREYSMQVKPLF